MPKRRSGKGPIGLSIAAALVTGFALGYLAPRPAPPLGPQVAPHAQVEDAQIGVAASQVINTRSFKVLRVIDGDTFTVPYDGEETSVRIHGIDAPEKKDPGGPEATAALRKLIEGRVVTLEFAETNRKRDKFGRLLCRVRVGSLDVGQDLLRRRIAQPYRP